MGGIYGGMKIARSCMGLPMKVSCQLAKISETFKTVFGRRACLIYTGIQRLAKDTLINALYECSLTLADACGGSSSSVVRTLAMEAEEAFTALQQTCCSNDPQRVEEGIDQMSLVLNSYWSLKKRLARGSEPEYVRKIRMMLTPVCSGISLCGAGAGGFMIVILKRDESFTSLEEVLGGIDPSLGISKHYVTVDSDGIVVEKLRRSEGRADSMQWIPSL